MVFISSSKPPKRTTGDARIIFVWLSNKYCYLTIFFEYGWFLILSNIIVLWINSMYSGDKHFDPNQASVRKANTP